MLQWMNKRIIIEIGNSHKEIIYNNDLVNRNPESKTKSAKTLLIQQLTVD